MGKDTGHSVGASMPTWETLESFVRDQVQTMIQQVLGIRFLDDGQCPASGLGSVPGK